MKVYTLIAIFILNLFIVKGQSLVVNEVSQGPAGSQEYVELLVTGPPLVNCDDIPPCLDLRGWIIDDNNGYLNGGPTSGVGIASGACRFSNDPFWSCIPAGTIILLYNDSDPNPSLGPDDTSMGDGNCALSIPISSNLFEHHTSQPSSSNGTYAATGWQAGGNWTPISMSNGSDGFLIYDPSNLATPVFSIGWGGSNNQGDIYMGSGSASDDVFYLSDCDFATQASWVQGCAGDPSCGGNDQTPGALNPGQANCIGQMNHNCNPPTVVITPTHETCLGDCDGSAVATVTGGTAPYNFSWSPAPPIGQGTNTISSLCAGTYTLTLTDDNGNGCVLTETTTINAGPNCGNPCFMTFLDVNLTACDPATSSFNITGSVEFTDPPATGQLIVENCSGDQAVFNPPFTSPTNYAINGINADGTTNCTVTAYFTADPACTITSNPFTEPVCNCNLDFFSVNFNPCDPNTDTYGADGEIQFTSPPTTGTLIVTIDDGVNPPYDTIINPPFVSPQLWSITGMATGTGTNATITVYFSDDPACTQTTNLAVPQSCSCPADAGTYNANITGSSTNNYILCFGDQIDVTHNNDETPPQDLNDPGTAYVPGIWWALYSCPPTPGMDILADPCFEGIVAQSYNWFDINDMSLINSFPPGTFTDNTVYFAPLTMYNINTGTYSLYPPPNLCFDLGAPLAVTYLPEITNNAVEDCPNGTVTVTISGGHPEIYGTDFTASNLLPVNASFNNTTTTHGGTIVISGLQDGDMYSFDVVDQNGCPITITGGPFVGPPDATINPAGPFCPNDPSVNLTAATPGGNWTGPGITNGANGTFDPATAGAGTHTITYTVGGTCPNSDQITITVTNQLDATISPAGPFCESNASTILVAVDPSGTWSGNGITDPALGTFDPATAGPGTHTITYEILGSCGALDTEDIIVIADDDATIDPAGPLCDTDPAFIMTAASPNGVWTASCGACIDAVTGTFDPSTAGQGSHTITYTIAGACGDSDDEIVDVSGQLDATITPAGPFCTNDAAVNMQAVDVGGTWSGTGIIDPILGTFDPAVAGPGTHTITYEILGSCGAIDTEDIIVISNESATITPVGPFCVGNPSLIMTAVDAGGTWSGNGIVDPATGEFDPSIAGPGTHVITYTIAGQCGDQETTTITVNDPLDVTAFTDMSICEGESGNLSALASGGDSNYTYIWTDDQGNQVGVGQSIAVTPAVTTTYTVTITDGCGSTAASDQVTITIIPLPVIDFTVDNATGCAPLTVTFTDNSVPAGTSCLWEFGDTFSSTDCGSVTHTYTAPGCYDVTLTSSTNGCSNSLTIPSMVCVSENAVADFSFTPDSTTVFDPSFDFTNFSSNADNYLWLFGDGGSSTETNPSYEYEANPNAYEVCLIAYTSEGCNDTICKSVIINDEFLLYVPNAFTPDGDIHNNDFGPVISGHIPESFEFLIFDRWGQLIFQSNHLNDRWNGTYINSGEMAKTDVYVWLLRVKSQTSKGTKEFRGHVTLLR